VGDVLVAANFMTEDAEGNYNLNLTNLQGQSATQIALNFVFAGLNALANLEVPLIALPGGGIYVAASTGASNSQYGLRIAADLSLTPTPNQNANGQAAPSLAFDVALGSWPTGETDATSWYARITDTTANPVPPGLSLFLLQRDASNNLSFAPSFELASVGIDVSGGGDAPLINLDGYTLAGAELRAYLNSSGWDYGFAIRLDNVGFPLGPSFQDAQAGAAGSNTVARNLLASANPGSGPSASAVNPGFSAEAGWVKGYGPLLEIYDAQGNQTDIIWFPVQGRFGPISCQQIGLQVEVTGQYQGNPRLGVVFDGSVLLDVLDVYLDQLSIDVALKQIAS
jgi:hypothetical protein